MSGPIQRPHPAADPIRLAVLDAYGLREAGTETGFDGIVQLARTLCAAPAALVSFVVEDCQWFAARSGFGPMQTPLSQSVCAHSLEVPGLLIIPDLTQDARTRDTALVTGKPNLRFYAGAPLRTGGGHTLGTVCVLDTYSRAEGLSQEQAEGLEALAGLVMAQLELRRSLIERDAELTALRKGRVEV